MTIDEIKNLETVEEIETRAANIAVEIGTADADALKSLNEELDALESRKAEIRAAKLQAAEDAKAVANGEGVTLRKFIGTDTEKGKTMENNIEIRNTREYIEAYANAIRNNDNTFAECRALLSTNATNGQVLVPEIVEKTIQTAWEKDELLSKVRKTFFRGNHKVQFELSADPAHVHAEGAAAPSEEALTTGIVTVIPETILKWIKLSTESATMGGEQFLTYVYSELTHQILKLLASKVVADIVALGTEASATAVCGAKITDAPAVTTVGKAYARLSDEAANPVIIMNKLTYEEFMSAHAAGNFSYDPFMKLPVLYTSALPAYATADANAVYMIVGDLDGEEVNYPEGDGIVFKYDDLSESEKGLIKIVGYQYAGHKPVKVNYFTRVAKPAATESASESDGE